MYSNKPLGHGLEIRGVASAVESYSGKFQGKTLVGTLAEELGVSNGPECSVPCALFSTCILQFPPLPASTIQVYSLGYVSTARARLLCQVGDFTD